MQRIKKAIAPVIAGAAAAAILASLAMTAPAQAASVAKASKAIVSLKTAKPKLAIGLNTNRTSRASLKALIRQRANAKGVKLSTREVNQAAQTAMNKLASAGNGPLKGIIHIKFRRFTICISWGEDKGHC